MKPIALALAALGASILTPASAAQFVRDGDRLMVSGSIGEGDSITFEIKLDDGVRTVSLNSSGGYLDEALEIGKSIRKRHLDTTVPAGATCQSACTLVWSAGWHRSAAGRIAMHCATTIAAPYQCDQAGRAQMLAFLKEMHTPRAMIAYQEAAGSTSELWIEPEKLAQIDPPPAEEPWQDEPPAPVRRRPPRYYGPQPYEPPPVYYPPLPITFPWGPCPISMLLSFGTVCI
jgi:hypothetical protein